MKPKVLRDFFEKYRRAKFPNDLIASNVLKSMSLPADRVASGLEIIKDNGRYAGIIRETPTGPFINLDRPAFLLLLPHQNFRGKVHLIRPSPPHKKPQLLLRQSCAALAPAAPALTAKANRVFITHGKQRAIVVQIKELLTFGSFDPVVSVEREATAIPVPEKVFEDMRSCSAGVIHVGAEGKYLDKDGIELTKLNDNVLIEIGAAMALYGKKVILLVERGVTLPSNLQGLYRCEFEGDKLEYDLTMKLLKTFSQFR